ncbi:MAG TPA: hypothetical protein VH678_23635 [Xanthobacteraceae bacterium]
MSQAVAALKLARRSPLHPAVVVAGILTIAATAKLGHGTWGIGGMFAFYPVYVATLAARVSLSSLALRRAHARVGIRR